MSCFFFLRPYACSCYVLTGTRYSFSPPCLCVLLLSTRYVVPLLSFLWFFACLCFLAVCLFLFSFPSLCSPHPPPPRRVFWLSSCTCVYAFCVPGCVSDCSVPRAPIAPSGPRGAGQPLAPVQALRGSCFVDKVLYPAASGGAHGGPDRGENQVQSTFSRNHVTLERKYRIFPGFFL